MSHLKELMNQGFLIFENSTKFVLYKIPTPSNPESVIENKNVAIEYPNYDAALKAALSFAKIENAPQQDILWSVELRYFHQGLGFKVEELSSIRKATYALAMSEAKLKADQHVKSHLDEKYVKSWEVRVRPIRQTS